MLSDTPTVLRRICDRKLEEIRERKTLRTLDALKEQALAQPAPRGFIEALRVPSQRGSSGGYRRGEESESKQGCDSRGF